MTFWTVGDLQLATVHTNPCRAQYPGFWRVHPWPTGLFVNVLFWVRVRTIVPSTELTRIYSCLLFLKSCCGHNLLDKPSFYLVGDGKLVLHCLWNPMITLPSELHYDLLSGTQWLLLECGFAVHLEHVKGHQDSSVITVLSWLKQHP